MILVSGTKRSGTSMWMQALVAGGFAHVGDRFAAHWEDSIRDANPHGFYESLFRQGIYFGTNPHPRTGTWLHPEPTENHVVKVFIPGLVRTDYAYIHRVVATVRDWRAYGPSLQRLYAMEDAWLIDHHGEERLQRARASRSTLPPHVEWFFENFELLRDVATRRYAVNVSTYDTMLRDPEKLLSTVFEWLEGGDVEAAVQAIEPSLRTQPVSHDLPEGVEPAHAAVFDELYDAIDAGHPLNVGLLQRLNDVHLELRETYGDLSPERGRDDPDDQML